MYREYKKKVAIIGAGPSGLVSVKYAVENDLAPVVFERSSTIGGLWAPENKRSAAWDGLTANVSFYGMAFSDHTYPEKSPIFSGKKEIFNYLTSYMIKFDLEKYIKFNTEIIEAKKSEDKWQLTFQTQGNKLQSEFFDFLIIASGLHETPHIPKFENQENFKGLQLHSSKFFLNHPKLKDKKVLVLGVSYSGADVAQNCVGHASSVVNLFTNPYFVIRRLIRCKKASTRERDNYFNVIPVDCFDFTRSLQYAGETEEEKMDVMKKIMNIANPEQVNKELSHPALYYDINEEKTLRITIADNYWDYVKQRKLTPKKGTIQKFAENGVYLSDGSFEECDAVIYGTGYNLAIDYLDESARNLIEFEATNYKIPYVQYMYTFHPDLENIGFVCQNEGLFFTASELQAKWITSVFSGKMPLPSREKMLKGVSQVRDLRNSHSKAQYVFGNHVELVDKLAKEIGVMPDLEKIKRDEPAVYEKLWENLLTSSSFLLGTKQDSLARDLLTRVDELTNYEYMFDDNDESNYVSISLLAKKFATNPNYTINMDIFKT